MTADSERSAQQVAVFRDRLSSSIDAQEEQLRATGNAADSSAAGPPSRAHATKASRRADPHALPPTGVPGTPTLTPSNVAEAAATEASAGPRHAHAGGGDGGGRGGHRHAASPGSSSANAPDSAAESAAESPSAPGGARSPNSVDGGRQAGADGVRGQSGARASPVAAGGAAGRPPPRSTRNAGFFD